MSSLRSGIEAWPLIQALMRSGGDFSAVATSSIPARSTALRTRLCFVVSGIAAGRLSTHATSNHRAESTWLRHGGITTPKSRGHSKGLLAARRDHRLTVFGQVSCTRPSALHFSSMAMADKTGTLRRMKLQELVSKMQQIEEQVALTLEEYPHGHTLERQRLVLAIAKQVHAHLADQLRGGEREPRNGEVQGSSHVVGDTKIRVAVLPSPPSTTARKPS